MHTRWAQCAHLTKEQLIAAFAVNKCDIRLVPIANHLSTSRVHSRDHSSAQRTYLVTQNWTLPNGPKQTWKEAYALQESTVPDLFVCDRGEPSFRFLEIQGDVFVQVSAGSFHERSFTMLRVSMSGCPMDAVETDSVGQVKAVLRGCSEGRRVHGALV